jgi:hypothetical protein
VSRLAEGWDANSLVLHSQLSRARRVAWFAGHAVVFVALDYRRVESCGTDAAARDTADREEIGAHATLVLEIGLEPFENRRRPVGGADAASGGRDNEHRHGPFAVHLGIGGLRLRVPSACRGADGRPLVRQGHWFTVAVADSNPMEGVQPRIDDAQGNHKREGIGADDARSRPLTEYLAVDRPVDRDMPLGTIAMTRPFSKSQFAKRLQTPGLAQLPSALLKLASDLRIDSKLCRFHKPPKRSYTKIAFGCDTSHTPGAFGSVCDISACALYGTS